MATSVIVPSEGGDICTVYDFAVKVGDHVEMGDLICSAETDKVTIDVVSPCAGTILALIHKEGDEVKAFDPVAVVGTAGEKVEIEESSEKPQIEPAGKSTETDHMNNVIPIPRSEGSKTVASPKAKKYALDNGISLEGIVGTGVYNSITYRDVIEAIKKACPIQKEEQTAAESSYSVRKLSRIQETSAKLLYKSLHDSAQFTITTRVCVDRLLELRKLFKACEDDARVQKITINDLYCFAVARTLVQFPRVNAIVYGDEIREYTAVNLGIAVDTEDGLIVPVIHDAQDLSLVELSVKAHELADKCKKHKQNAKDLSGGTFTVSNLGSDGIETFTPIINSPQVAILGVGAPVGRVILKNGVPYEIQEAMLSLTLDHRFVDGVPGSKFLKVLRRNIENIDVLLARQ